MIIRILDPNYYSRHFHRAEICPAVFIAIRPHLFEFSCLHTHRDIETEWQRDRETHPNA